MKRRPGPRVLSYLSVITHFESFAKGVLDSKDAILLSHRDLPGTVLHRALPGIAALEVIDESQWLKARQTKYAAYATIYILVVIAAVAVANVLADRYNKSFDATSNKRYSLSDQTAKIVKGLKQDATIIYFNQTTQFRDGKDLLDQYANLSPKVQVEYVDPDKKPQVAREAGIRNLWHRGRPGRREKEKKPRA